VVKHPGTTGTKYFSNAVKDNERFVNDELTQALKNVLNSIR
jgi:hypothetical protein